MLLIKGDNGILDPLVYPPPFLKKKGLKKKLKYEKSL